MDIMFWILKLQLQVCAVVYKQVSLILMWEMTGVQSELILLSHMLARVYLKGVQEGGKHLRLLLWFGRKKNSHAFSDATHFAAFFLIFSEPPPRHCFGVIYYSFCVFLAIPTK